jgi:hypothetical protein
MGGTSCRYSSFGTGYSNCNSYYQNGSALTAGAIAGIVIGSLVGIVFIILILVFIYKLTRRNNSSSNQRRPMNVYGLPMNTNNHQESTQTSEMFTPSKPPAYDNPYENV